MRSFYSEQHLSLTKTTAGNIHSLPKTTRETCNSTLNMGDNTKPVNFTMKVPYGKCKKSNMALKEHITLYGIDVSYANTANHTIKNMLVMDLIRQIYTSGGYVDVYSAAGETNETYDFHDIIDPNTNESLGKA